MAGHSLVGGKLVKAARDLYRAFLSIDLFEKRLTFTTDTQLWLFNTLVVSLIVKRFWTFKINFYYKLLFCIIILIFWNKFIQNKLKSKSHYVRRLTIFFFNNSKFYLICPSMDYDLLINHLLSALNNLT